MALAAKLRGKDEEVERLVAWPTQGLEQKHQEALNAQARAHDDKVNELEAEHDGLKRQVQELTGERDAAKSALADAQAAVLGKADLLSKANDSINDLRLKLEGLERTLSEVRAREETLTKDLEEERQLRRNDAANHEDYVKGENL